MTSKLGKKILEPAAWLSNLYYINFVQNVTYCNAIRYYRKPVYISNFQGVDHDMRKHSESTIPKKSKKNQDPNVDEFSTGGLSWFSGLLLIMSMKEDTTGAQSWAGLIFLVWDSHVFVITWSGKLLHQENDTSLKTLKCPYLLV